MYYINKNSESYLNKNKRGVGVVIKMDKADISWEFETKGEFIRAKNIKKFQVEGNFDEILENCKDSDVIAIGVQINSPLKVVDIKKVDSPSILREVLLNK